MSLAHYVEGSIDILPSGPHVSIIRKGQRCELKEDHRGFTLARYLGGKIPYHYRRPDKIALDFSEEHDAVELIFSIFSQLPDSKKFQESHSGEILSSVYIEEVMGYKKLYSKLTMTTAQNTNVHKMDGFFVDTTVHPFHYLFVETKTSIRPVGAKRFSGHKSGILKDMLRSLNGYRPGDERFDFTKIRDNLSHKFSPEHSAKIRSDLIPPGPLNSSFLGIAVINKSTVNQSDDDFILSEPCTRSFDFSSIIVQDLSDMAAKAFKISKTLLDALQSIDN